MDASIPGLVSYFQIDADGTFSTPLLPAGIDPATYGIAADEITQRRALEGQVRALLTSPQSSVDVRRDATDELGGAKKKLAKDEGGQAVFDQLSEPNAGRQVGGQLRSSQLGRRGRPEARLQIRSARARVRSPGAGGCRKSGCRRAARGAEGAGRRADHSGCSGAVERSRPKRRA